MARTVVFLVTFVLAILGLAIVIYDVWVYLPSVLDRIACTVALLGSSLVALAMMPLPPPRGHRAAQKVP